MNLVQGTLAVLNDAKHFLEQINTEQYNQSISLMSDSTIGQHTRHFIEFYQCLITQANTRKINYCLRKRDITIEQSPEAALAAINIILRDFNALDFERSVLLSSSKEGIYEIRSTVSRELYYNLEHCIHHLALIRVAINIIAPNIRLPEHFGIAPSTLQHRRLVNQQIH